uniref:Predicted protein putative n=1 Tax=Albugo laibachii Nc14 TaxID=890382 RepID=F0W1W2_9STRA|nr:predicted protein putative [Albugo laibachii Nc14]|eukprot:CCA15041.1 predicted protein putative [Albugo laibachii Nc14]
MSVSIKVSVRCRPFTCDDKLGVFLTQSGEEEGEVQLINSTYSTTRFPFSYAWWSAYGFQRHVQGNLDQAQAMELVDQAHAYQSVGVKMKDDLLTGNAVVLFAYGLSGSGKTYTVFGPDAIDTPDAWFRHKTPHPQWGLFPRLAYEVFNEKQDGWKISMKYFQNVVDTVRDLMSPVAQEQQYKAGIKKDPDGFTDIEWCQSVILKDWNDLRRTFMAANARKAIAPTQFNHQSTRGHCIMTLEVEKPDPEREGIKQKGRVYVCDLAGTEPAGDIVYAEYKKVVFENGDQEYKYLGPHRDPSKSKELQDQGKKINLSLTEMAQFFMKMAEMVKANKLKPGMSIPGCNSYFLCKYLKDTMLQARTYLFCAIRPEVKFHNYTFATLGFAKNASVIKLQPKKACGVSSPAERKLLAELEQMKLLVKELRQENEKIAQTQDSLKLPEADMQNEKLQMEQLAEMVAQKRRELESVLLGESGSTSGAPNAKSAQDELMQRQREEYAKRGIHLYHFESETTSPYLLNLDVDAYRSKRFMFLLNQPKVTIGPHGDIKPMSLNIVENHCSFQLENGEIVLFAGAGDVIHNGSELEKDGKRILKHFDRVAIATELMLFVHPAQTSSDTEPTADDAAQEYQRALQSVDNAAMLELQEEMKRFQEEKAKWELQKAQPAITSPESQHANPSISMDSTTEKELLARQVNDQELREVLPKIMETRQIVQALNRGMLDFETTLQSSTPLSSDTDAQTALDEGSIAKVKIKVQNNDTEEIIFLDVFEFVKAHAMLKDEVAFLRNAIMNDREYASPPGHEPITLFFDHSFQIGSATTFPEYLLYNLETDSDEAQLNVKLAVPPFNTIGKLEVVWAPLSSPDSEKHQEQHLVDIESPTDFLGKPWTYKLQIRAISGLPLITELAYCQYEFLGELFTTETVEQHTRNPVFGYECIHHIESVTPNFIDFLQHRRIEFQVFVTPYIMNLPKDTISTRNSVIVANLGGQASSTEALSRADVQDKLVQLKAELQDTREELTFLQQAYQAATGRLQVAMEFLRLHALPESSSVPPSTQIPG